MMRHGISELEWIEYLDGSDGPDQFRMAAHLEMCPECRGFLKRMRAVDTALSSAASRIREEIVVAPDQLAQALENSLTDARDRCVSVRIGALYLLLASMCGRETSSRAIRAAAHRILEVSPGLMRNRLWTGFLDNLQSIIAPLCGEPAARLIWERGMNWEQGRA